MSLKPSETDSPSPTSHQSSPHNSRARGTGTLINNATSDGNARSVLDDSSKSATNKDEQHSASLVTVLIAVAANLIIAIAKTIAAFMTGSASMIAESAHSWADAGNGTLLIVAEKRLLNLLMRAIRSATVKNRMFGR